MPPRKANDHKTENAQHTQNAICLVTNDEEIEKNATKITEDVTCYKTDRSWDATHLL